MKKLSLFSGVLLLFFSSCVATDDYDFDSMEGISLSPRMAFPLLKGELGIENLLNEEDSINLSIREDDVLYFHYEVEYESGELLAELEIPDVTFEEEIPLLPEDLPIPINIPANTGWESPEMEFQLFMEAEQHFRSVHYKGGELQHSLSSDIDIPLEITYTFPSITREGEALSQTLSINSGSSGAGVHSLANYVADLTSGENSYNSIPFTIQIRILPQETDIEIPAGSSLSAGFGLVDQEYSFISGFFGEMNLSLSEMSLEVGPFDEIFEDVTLADMEIDMQVINSYGIPMHLSFPDFVATNLKGDEVRVRTNPSAEIAVAFPETPGEEASTNIQIVNGSEVFNANPEEIRYTAEVHVNKDREDANNFVSDESTLKFKLAADVPLIGSFRKIEIQDTVDVDFKSDFEEFNVKDLVLRTKLENEFPFAGDFQVYLLDEQYHVTDSLLLENQRDIIVSSSVTPEGDLASPGVSDEEIQIAQDKLDLLTEASHLIIKATLHTSSGADNDYPPVKFKSSYRLGIDLDILAELETTIEL